MNHKKLTINGIKAVRFNLVKKYNKIFLNGLVYLKKLTNIHRPYFRDKYKLKRFIFANNRIIKNEKMIDRFYFEHSKYYCNEKYFVNEKYLERLYKWL